MSVLVITPIQGEIDFFLQGCAEQGIASTTINIGRLPVIHFPALDMLVALGGLGKTQFAVQAQYLLDRCESVEVLICAGAAGALSPILAIGDVVVGTETVEHDIRNRFGKPLLPRFPSHPATVTSFQQLPPDSTFQLHVGPIASGDEDVVDSARGQEIYQRTNALAVAWEGVGGARACQFSEVPFVEIRGITDNANHTAATDFEQNLQASLRNVAKVVTQWAILHRQRA